MGRFRDTNCFQTYDKYVYVGILMVKLHENSEQQMVSPNGSTHNSSLLYL